MVKKQNDFHKWICDIGSQHIIPHTVNPDITFFEVQKLFKQWHEISDKLTKEKNPGNLRILFKMGSQIDDSRSAPYPLNLLHQHRLQ